MAKKITTLAKELRPFLITVKTPMSAVDHGALTGLTDDDHAQYVAIGTARTITAVHAFAPGSASAPFTLGANAQGQLVTGLRADQVNKSIGVSGLGLSGGGLLTADRTITLTSSSNPGAAAGVLASDASGRIRLEGLGLGADPSDTYILNIVKTATGAGEKVPVWIRTKTTTAGVSLVGARFETSYEGNTPTASTIVGINPVAAAFVTGGEANLTAVNSSIWAVYGGKAVDAVNYVASTWTDANNVISSRIGFMFHDSGAGSISSTQYGIVIGAISAAPSNYGIYMNNITGATAAYAIYTNSGLVRLGDYTQIVKAGAEQLRLSYDGSNYASFGISSGGNLTIAPTGDLVLDPVGNDVYPNNNYDLNLGLLNKKWLTLHAAELWVETLVAQDTIATIGGRILVGPTSTLTADLAAADGTIYLKHNSFASGDTVYLEASGKVEFMALTSGPSGAGPYSYTVTRNLDGTGANDWYAGDAVFNTGTTGDGFIDLYSVRGVKAGTQYGPAIVGNVRNSTTYNDWSEHWAIGNLNGVYGYGADTYGVGLGKYANDASYLTADATNGIRIMRGATQLAKWAMDGSILIGQAAASQDNISIASGALSIRNNTTERIGMTAAGIMTIKDSGGNAVFTFDASAGAEFTKALTLGTSGGIYQGSGTFASPTTGLKLFNSSGAGKLAGYNAGVEQAAFDTDGKLKAGAGAVIIDADGVTLSAYNMSGSSVKWKIGSATYGKIFTYAPGSYENEIVIWGGESTASNYLNTVRLTAAASGYYAWAAATLTITNQSGFAFDRDVGVTGAITASGTIKSTSNDAFRGKTDDYMRIRSDKSVAVIIDDDNDDTTAKFEIYNNGVPGTNLFYIDENGNTWVKADCSALTFTDRTPYPESTEQAYRAVQSMRRVGQGLDHGKLDSFVKNNGGRNLSASVSAINEVIISLIERINRLEGAKQ